MKTLKYLIIGAFLLLFQVSTAQQGEVVLTKNLKAHIVALADDSMEGRQTGSKGEAMASDYIGAQFTSIGLEPKGDEQTYLQKFSFTMSRKYGEDNSLVIDGKTIKTDEDYYPLMYSTNGSVDAETIQVGFGISAPKLDHDDYSKLSNLEGKVFIIEISSPDGIHPHSKYKENSDLRTKIDLAIEKGCSGIIFVNSDSTADDPTNPRHIRITPSSVPVIFLNGESSDALLLKKAAHAKISVEWTKVEGTGHNVVGMLNNNKKETVIIGAHYDHLGFGGEGSLYRGKTEEIHNGADDNASGVAALIELARYCKSLPEPKYNYLFIAFSGEEMGLLGSKHYAKEPSIDLSSVNYMFNMDMVGRFDTAKKSITAMGVGTSPTWKEIVHNSDTTIMKIATTESGIGPSDHTSFYLKDIPVLHFFTGTHTDYHKPTDDEEKINYEGMILVHEYLVRLITELEKRDRLVFSKTKDSENKNNPGFKVTLGVIPDYAFEGSGMRIDGVSEDRPAQKAGMKTGDIVIQMGDVKIVDMMSYMKGLSKFEKGQSTAVIVKRGKEEKSFEVTF